ncbi:RmlC-like cupin domain-containing protein [Xylariales sp. PMI_506]|nr:RmlC-like cupin domain-containing protein [Xylariales sp. PMI_506]
MKGLVFAAAVLSTAAAFPSGRSTQRLAARDHALVLAEAPGTAQPYVLRKGAGQAVQVGSQIYRFSVTGNSSDGAFTLMQTNAPDSTALGVLPHTHLTHYENFYCTKGRVQVWAETEASGEQARVLTAGDYGAVPQNTTHTFQITDPDTQLTGVIQPGGFEALFIAIAQDSYYSAVGAEFVPAATVEEGLDESLITALEEFDVYAQLDYTPRRDFVNGTAGGSGNWHNGTNTLAADSVTPNFIAKNYGPKYLNTDDGIYRLLAPLATGNQTSNNFTMGTMTMSPLLSNMTIPATVSYSQPLAFQLEEGMLVLQVEGYTDPVSLIQGDVIFLPANTTFSYYAAVSFTHLLYVSGGADGIDYDLMSRSESWDYATYPVTA